MTVRRGAVRLAAVCALVGGAVLVGATPASADDDLVRVRASSSFTAGGSPGSVAVEVRKRSDGCVMLRTALGLRLAGVRADQVEVQVSAGGQWWPVPVSGGGVLNTARTSPANATLCKGKAVTVRYRVTFRPGAPAGRLTVAGEASTATGRTIGRGADTSQVRAGRVATPGPTPERSATPTPTPTPAVETGPPTEDPTAESTLAAAAGDGVRAADEGGSGGGLSLVMVLGVAMVVAGLALIVVLFRRSRADRQEPGGSASGLPLPGSPGGTTYRSGSPVAGGGHPVGPVAGPGHPAGPTGYPPPPGGRPATPGRGTVYPSSPQAFPVEGYPPRPPEQGYPHVRSGQSGTVYPAPRSGRPDLPPPPESTGGGDSTSVMPRLPE